MNNAAADFTGRLTTIESVMTFLLAGNATITIRSVGTGTRFTFRVRAPKEVKFGSAIWFVNAMTGPDNDSHYQYLGQIREDNSYDRGRKSRIGEDAPIAKSFNWFWQAVQANRADLFDLVEVWHEGRCGRCGRKLTVPESVESGFGPECINHIDMAA